MERPIVNYSTQEARFGSVASVAGRDFVVIPYENTVCVPKEIVDADSKHPERGMLNHQIEWYVENLLLDIMEYQRDALAATVIKDSENERAVRYRLLMPVLMPVDTRDRWADTSDAGRRAYEERLRKAAADRKADMSTSRSYRMVEWNGDTSQPETREQLEQERTELEQDLGHLRRLLGEEVLGSGTHRLASLLISCVEHRLSEIEYLLNMEE